jgi:phosphate transport system substrate-binding protein
VQVTAGSIGYVEAVYATQNQIPFGAVQNASGVFVKSSIASVTAVADGAAPTMPDDFRVSITNAPGEAAYPIASFTWLLFYETPQDTTQAAAMVAFMKWALTDGQAFASELGYSPLPASVVERELVALERIRTQ